MSTLRHLVRRDTPGGRALRCFGVSVLTTVLSAIVLVVLVLAAGVAPGPANVVAVGCGIPVSYVANRRWAWGRSGTGSLAREVAPFWALSLTGLACSTVAVAAIGAGSAGWPDAVRAVALPLAEAGTFAALWVAQFLLLDRVVFRPPAPDDAVASPPRPHSPAAV